MVPNTPLDSNQLNSTILAPGHHTNKGRWSLGLSEPMECCSALRVALCRCTWGPGFRQTTGSRQTHIYHQLRRSIPQCANCALPAPFRSGSALQPGEGGHWRFEATSTPLTTGNAGLKSNGDAHSQKLSWPIYANIGRDLDKLFVSQEKLRFHLHTLWIDKQNCVRIGGTTGELRKK